MKPLEISEQRQLLAIARRAIEAAVCRAGPEAVSTTGLDSAADLLSARLSEPAAAFVTIREHGQLRGCIGLMRFEAPLWLNVHDAARAAALDDPRFLPVAETELALLRVEVSVLEPPVALADPAGFVAGRHGIIIERGMRRALLLPQVATEMGWDSRQMLEAVCRKANLPVDAWRDGSAQLQIFESACFGETDKAREKIGR
jgi:AmmeMemoRadiSam system protein A